MKIFVLGVILETILGASLALAASDRVPGQLIVKFKEVGNSYRLQSQMVQSLRGALGETSILDTRPLETDGSLHQVILSDDRLLGKALVDLSRNPAVAYAEPNYIYHLFDNAPNDPDFNQSWGLSNVGQTDSEGSVGVPGADVRVLPLWQAGFTGSRNVLVAVIDTGIDWSHPDLVGNLYTNPGEAGELATNGIDDDGNGFIDDVHGWNFAADTNNSSDDNDHGSHCAGVIGAEGNNGVGVAGVNWQVSLLPVKFISASGSGTLEGAINAINYARQMKVRVMSNSWGGTSFSQGIQDAVQAARDEGILFVAAAGNSSMNNDERPTYPASFPVDNIVAVAAMNNQAKAAAFSNFGPKTVHVAAPGVNVYSTVRGGRYESFSGTSMAAPHVAGVAALMASVMPDMGYAEIKERLIKTSDPAQFLRKKVLSRGRVNAYNAVHNIVPPSTEPDESKWQTVDMVLESDHNYTPNLDVKYPISVPGAKFIRLHFSVIDTERNYDPVILVDGAGAEVERFSGKMADRMSDYLVGDRGEIWFQSDSTKEEWGFKVDYVQVIFE